MLIMRAEKKQVFTEEQKRIVKEYSDNYSYDFIVYDNENILQIDLHEKNLKSETTNKKWLISEIIGTIEGQLEDSEHYGKSLKINLLKDISILKYDKVITTKSGRIIV